MSTDSSTEIKRRKSSKRKQSLRIQAIKWKDSTQRERPYLDRVAGIDDEFGSNKKLYIFLTLIVFTALVATALAVTLYFLLNYVDFCNLDHEPSEYEIILCQRQIETRSCDLDASSCTEGCALGFKTNQLGCSVSCDCADVGNLENDIRFNPVNLLSVLTAYINEEDTVFDLNLEGNQVLNKRWDQHVVAGRYRVPYVYEHGIADETKALIEKAMSNISAYICTEFIVRTNELDYVEFSSAGYGCSSYVGRFGGRQQVTLGRGCESLGSALHQLLHVLGLWHEQSRNDRNRYVNILLENVAKENRFHFGKRRVNVQKTDVPYRQNSIMHVFGYFYSSNGYPTIVDRSTLYPVEGQRNFVTEKDVDKLKEIYQCSEDAATGVSVYSAVQWGIWTTWQSCSATCSVGQRARVRECQNSAGSIVSRNRCSGSYFEMKECQTVPCSDGVWGTWSSCSVTCGMGVRHRISCCYPNEKYEQESCSLEECPSVYSAEGEIEWGEWGPWGRCTRSCGGGYRQRSRECFNQYYNRINDEECPLTVPASHQYGQCALQTCGVTADSFNKNVAWLSWEPWSACSQRDGFGVQTRLRRCLDCANEPMTEQRDCVGDGFIDGNWGDWSIWTRCATGCTGQTTRYRTCLYRQSQIVRKCVGGTDVVGRGYERQNCTAEICATASVSRSAVVAAAQWSGWSHWGPCSSSCHGSTQWRSRTCLHEGKEVHGCPYNSKQLQSCGYHFPECDLFSGVSPTEKSIEGRINSSISVWGDWWNWGSCSVSCGEGQQVRERICLTRSCLGSEVDFRACLFNEPCDASDNLLVWKKCALKFCSQDSFYHTGHFNKDTLGDLACVERSQIIIYAGNEEGTFDLYWQGHHDLCEASYVEQVVVGDFNGDRIDDIACPHEGHITVLYGKPDEAFQDSSPVEYKDVCAAAAKVYLGYMDRNSKIDVICGAIPAESLPEKIVYNEMFTT